MKPKKSSFIYIALFSVLSLIRAWLTLYLIEAEPVPLPRLLQGIAALMLWSAGVGLAFSRARGRRRPQTALFYSLTAMASSGWLMLRYAVTAHALAFLWGVGLLLTGGFTLLLLYDVGPLCAALAAPYYIMWVKVFAGL